MSWISNALKYPDVFSFSDFPYTPVDVSSLKMALDENNRDVATWSVVAGGCGWEWSVVVGGGWWWLIVVSGGQWWLVVAGGGLGVGFEFCGEFVFFGCLWVFADWYHKFWWWVTCVSGLHHIALHRHVHI